MRIVELIVAFIGSFIIYFIPTAILTYLAFLIPGILGFVEKGSTMERAFYIIVIGFPLLMATLLVARMLKDDYKDKISNKKRETRSNTTSPISVDRIQDLMDEAGRRTDYSKYPPTSIGYQNYVESMKKRK
ncbi:MAG: hypothetical protein PHS23_05705 [Candidatus Cloacimonetes bacterium]|nr:hypothetical protein [Candidatus Cloacimonadota bacterium]